MAQNVILDPVLDALENAPLVPLTEHEQRLIADAESAHEERIPHEEIERKLRERADAAWGGELNGLRWRSGMCSSCHGGLRLGSARP